MPQFSQPYSLPCVSETSFCAINEWLSLPFSFYFTGSNALRQATGYFAWDTFSTVFEVLLSPIFIGKMAQTDLVDMHDHYTVYVNEKLSFLHHPVSVVQKRYGSDTVYVRNRYAFACTVYYLA